MANEVLCLQNKVQHSAALGFPSPKVKVRRLSDVTIHR